MRHHSRENFEDFDAHPGERIRHVARHFMKHFAGHRRGRGFGHFIGNIMDEAGFDRSAFRTGRKLASDDLQLLLLALIAEKPSHGYDLIKLLDERSGGYYAPSPGMVYPALTFLEEAGHATVEPEGTKKLYHASAQGREYLAQNRAQADALLSQLDRIGSRREGVRRAFTERGDDGDSNELREARHEVRRALRERKHVSAEESRRITEILRRATAEIIGKQ
jgi:DNA-binding PadR family transcriptional regulator